MFEKQENFLKGISSNVLMFPVSRSQQQVSSEIQVNQDLPYLPLKISYKTLKNEVFLLFNFLFQTISEFV